MNPYTESERLGSHSGNHGNGLPCHLREEHAAAINEREEASLLAGALIRLSEELNETFRRLVEHCISIVGGQRRFASALGKKESTVRSWRLARSNPSRSNIREVAAFASGLCGKAIMKCHHESEPASGECGEPK